MAHFPSVGEQFGAYRITGQLGRGGMGVVFAAEQVDLGRTVALKVLSPELAEQDDYRRRFIREATVLARVDSPHIITIFDHGEHDGCLYIATQHVAGGDLGVALRAHGPVPAAQAAEIAAQLALALVDAHQAGIVHRDVKPSNVLLRGVSADVFAYLCDFGIAQDSSPGLTAAGAVAGTFAYLAPERARGEDATPAADLYALGCVLWTALTDSTPYDGTDVEIALAHVSAPVPQLLENSPVAAEVNTVLRTALAKSPGDRYPSAGAMRSALLEVARIARTTPHPPLQARPQHPTGPPPRPPAGAHPPHGSMPSHPSGIGSAPTRLPSVPSSPPPPPVGYPGAYAGAFAAPSPAPRPRRNRTPLVVAAVVVATALAAGGITAVAIGGDDPDPAGTVATDPPAPPAPPDRSDPTEPTDSPTGTDTPSPAPTTPTTPSSPTTPRPTEKPGPKPFYPDVRASSGVELRLGRASVRAIAGWGTIDDGIVERGVGARDYSDFEGYYSSVFLRRSKPPFPLDSISLLDTVARTAAESLADADDLTLLKNERLRPAWLDGEQAARTRAAYRSAGDGLELAEETWFVMKGRWLYRLTFQFSRIDSLEERQAQIDPMVVSFGFD